MWIIMCEYELPCKCGKRRWLDVNTFDDENDAVKFCNKQNEVGRIKWSHFWVKENEK